MNIFTKKTTLRSYRGEEYDFIRKPLSEAPNINEVPQIIKKLSEITELFPYRIYVAGGFATYLAGVNSQYGDIDIFCFGEDVRVEVAKHLGPHYQTKKTGVVDSYNLFNNTYRPCCDLISILPNDKEYQGNEVGNIEEHICTFDMNWCMFGIDFHKREYFYHPLALNTNVFINENAGAPSYSHYSNRVSKYAMRRTIMINEANVKQATKDLKFIIDNSTSRMGIAY